MVSPWFQVELHVLFVLEMLLTPDGSVPAEEVGLFEVAVRVGQSAQPVLLVPVVVPVHLPLLECSRHPLRRTLERHLLGLAGSGHADLDLISHELERRCGGLGLAEAGGALDVEGVPPLVGFLGEVWPEQV